MNASRYFARHLIADPLLQPLAGNTNQSSRKPPGGSWVGYSQALVHRSRCGSNVTKRWPFSHSRMWELFPLFWASLKWEQEKCHLSTQKGCLGCILFPPRWKQQTSCISRFLHSAPALRSSCLNYEGNQYVNNQGVCLLLSTDIREFLPPSVLDKPNAPFALTQPYVTNPK